MNHYRCSRYGNMRFGFAVQEFLHRIDQLEFSADVTREFYPRSMHAEWAKRIAFRVSVLAALAMLAGCFPSTMATGIRPGPGGRWTCQETGASARALQRATATHPGTVVYVGRAANAYSQSLVLCWEGAQ